MTTHDIIDNRNLKLADSINQVLATSKSVKFAVGYFFLSGFEAIAEKLDNLGEVKLLIGNTTNKDTLEMLAEGYRRLELVRDELEKETYCKRTDRKDIAENTAGNVRIGIELMDQTDEGQNLLETLIRMIEDKRLKVKVYTRGRLHSKAYIFNYGQLFDKSGGEVTLTENGIAIIGSSNLSLSGIRHNTELNVFVRGNKNHEELSNWFEELWDEAEDFDELLMLEMKESWAIAKVTPYDIYMKTLYELVKERIEGGEDQEILWDDEIIRDLADFQQVAVLQAIQIIKDTGGCFIADVVGLGKSFIGAAIVKHFERTTKARPLIICPASLTEMWEHYNETYELNAKVLSMGMLRTDENDSATWMLDDDRFMRRDFVLIDESHHFRHSDTLRYQVVESFMSTGKRCCFLTATPRNKSAWDIYYQIKLFHRDDVTDLPVDPPNLKEYFNRIEHRERKLPELLRHLQIRRLRNHILKWYGYDSKTHKKVDASRFDDYKNGSKRAYVLVGGKHNFFPVRELKTIQYSIEDTYQGLYTQIRGYLGKRRKRQLTTPKENEITYARYGLWHYVIKSKQDKEPYKSLKSAGQNLRGLIRVLLFKRFESSVYAFRESIKRMLIVHERFLEALEDDIVPAGDDAQAIIYEPNMEEEQDILDALRKLPPRYSIEDFDAERLKEHIEHDIKLFMDILNLVEPITPEKDAKLQKLKSILEESPLKDGKRLIFSQYADTAKYIYENINPNDVRDDIDVIHGSNKKNKVRAVGRFAPKANPQFKPKSGDSELFTLVATDVLSEGLNLQDCDKIVNYDLHWNPVRLIQRFGRIDRIGSEFDNIYGFNFLPEAGIEKQLGLRERLKNRIQEIHDTIGEDAAILDPSEHLNEEAMYAIYEQENGGQLDLFESVDEEIMDLNEAEEILRQLLHNDPKEYGRIANLRDGIRSAYVTSQKGLYVFCQAGRYQQLFLVDDKGEIVSRDIPRVIGTIKCTMEEEGRGLPAKYNKAVMRVKKMFAEEVKHRESELAHKLNLTIGQKYLLRELKIYFENVDDSNIKANINKIEKAFRQTQSTAVNRELNRIRNNGLIGDVLFERLKDIYLQHNLSERPERKSLAPEEHPIPRIICSEALL